ncbi:septum formation family protein [Saccharomonospora saliphila]|uniref:septum formation family protein n=1 Tax=Saccharomonospora saliphila TaxID=369829 RepID=UPI00037D0E51|nr:septum formation family protein [Saccharomonospora saliphila]
MMEAMSAQPDPSSPESALRTRVLMVGVLVGAVAAMSLSWLLSWTPVEDDQEQLARQQEREAEQVAEIREKAFRSPPGSCLNWEAADARDVAKVACDEEHLFEVVGLADLAEDHGPNAPMPDEQGWRDLTEQHCGQLAEDYLDDPLDPEGKLTVGVLRPDADRWAEGDRTLHCGLQWVGPGGGLQTLTEPAAEMNQSYVWETGTCLGIAEATVSDPVSCSEEHSYEIVGRVDLREEFDEYPSEDEQHAWLDPTCAGIVEDYTDGKTVEDLREAGLILTWDLRSQESWNAGSSLVNCKVGALLDDDSGLAPVQGSVKDEAKEKGAESDDGDAGSGDGEKSGGGDSGDAGSGDGANGDGASGDAGSGDSGSGDSGSGDAGSGDGGADGDTSGQDGGDAGESGGSDAASDGTGAPDGG